jgi:hypothetical protein
MAVQTDARDASACGMTTGDIEGTFAGTFDNRPSDTLVVTFTGSRETDTDWTVQGWQGHGTGRLEFGSTGPQWTNSNVVTGVVNGTDAEIYRSVSVTCADGDSRATTINGVVDSGDAMIPFTISRN